MIEPRLGAGLQRMITGPEGVGWEPTHGLGPAALAVLSRPFISGLNVRNDVGEMCVRLQSKRRAAPSFGVRELGPAFSTADSSAAGDAPRLVGASKSGDESPHSKVSFRPAAVRTSAR